MAAVVAPALRAAKRLQERIQIIPRPRGRGSFDRTTANGIVQSADNVLIGGFILGGVNSNAKVLARAMGPSLTAFGINNALSDPTLELHDGNGGLLATNDNWKSAQSHIEATHLQPARTTSRPRSLPICRLGSTPPSSPAKVPAALA